MVSKHWTVSTHQHLERINVVLFFTNVSTNLIKGVNEVLMKLILITELRLSLRFKVLIGHSF